MQRKVWLVGILVLLVLCVAACGQPAGDPGAGDAEGNEAGDLTPVTVVLDWTPNTNHTGLYVALDQGFFKEQGLDVQIVQPGDNVATQLVAAGKADFGVSYQEEVTFARTQGVPVVSIAAVIQHNTSCFAAPKDRNIKTVKDFAGKRYGGWGGEVENRLLAYLLEQEGLGDEVEIVNLGTSDFFAATASNTVDFSWIYYGWAGIEAEQRGVELDTIYLKDLDQTFDYYTPVLVAAESFLAEKPEIARQFLAATAQGYEFCEQHPDQAAAILLAAAPELNEELVTASQAWLADQYTADASQWGWQKPEIWSDYAGWLMDNGLLEPGFEAEKAFTNDYLPQAAS